MIYWRKIRMPPNMSEAFVTQWDQTIMPRIWMQGTYLFEKETATNVFIQK